MQKGKLTVLSPTADVRYTRWQKPDAGFSLRPFHLPESRKVANLIVIWDKILPNLVFYRGHFVSFVYYDNQIVCNLR